MSAEVNPEVSAEVSRVLVTGGSGYLGTHLVAALLRAGRPVRATVRSAAREAGLRAAVRRGGADDGALEVVAADLTADDGWRAAAAGCAEVHHVASPIPVVQPDDPDDLIVPARDGVLRALRAAREAGARRVVLTSSFAAVGYTPKPVAEFTEDDWTDPDTPGLAPYPRSKTLAERAAWEWLAREGGIELVVVNPTFILGPTLTTELRSSTYLVKMMLEGSMSVAPRQRFGVVDVRDVADLHLRAMAEPKAAGRRFLAVGAGPTLGFLQVADVLRRRMGPLGARVPTREAAGAEPPRPVIRNDRAREELGWRPRDVETTIVQTAESLRDLGMLEDRRGGQRRT
ncbi:NAD-dependent epimerase/dehydratase family protein [Streptosporangiaceae bacterium NEAU-GS5]|nr:NAD-dependent epimerase/dehydratase family protein [Streptosporangiaceae bacterium NEAU-GS5]